MIKKHILIIPYLALNGAILVIALFKAFQISIGYYPLVGLIELTWDYYLAVLTDARFLASTAYSIYLALTATILSLVIGLGIAFILIKWEKSHPVVMKIVKTPISLPHIIVTLMALQILGQSGILSRLLWHLGLINQASQFPLLIHDKMGLGIILVFLYKEIPYVAIAVLAILKQINFGYVQVARKLGASAWQSFWHIILPLVQPTLATLFVILFSFTFGSFEVPFLLGNPARQAIAVTAYNMFSQPDLLQRPVAMALNIVISLICLGISLLTLAISRRFPGGRVQLEKK